MATHTKPLRVLFLHATWHDTSEYKVHGLLSEYAEHGLVESHFIWQHTVQEDQRPRLLMANASDRIVTYDFGRDMALDPRPGKLRRALLMINRFPRALQFLSSRIREIRPDVIYTSQQYYEVLLGHLLSRLFNIPHVIHISYAVGPWLGKQTLRTIRNTPYLIACSDYVRDTAISEGVLPHQIQTLLHGADLRAYDIEGDRIALRASFGWPSSTPVIIAAGRLDPGKGIDVLLDAFAVLRQTMPQARLIICGTSSTGDGFGILMKQKARDYRLEKHVVFAGFRRDLPQLLAGSDVFCLPTEHDALPLVFLGAMAARLPVVGVRSGGVPEMVVHEENGLLADPGDVRGIAQHLTTLLTDKQMAKRLGQAGYVRAIEKHNPRAVAHCWGKMLHQTLARQKESPSETDLGVWCSAEC